MKFDEYRILAYAKSAMDPVGTDFIIVLRSKAAGAACVQSVLLTAWQSMFHSAADVDLEYLQDFIYDLRQQSHPNNGSDPDFFESLSDLNIGPLRTSSSGEIEMLDISLIHDEFNGQYLGVRNCSADAFNALAKQLRKTQSPIDSRH